jgi:DNA polymerase IV
MDAFYASIEQRDFPEYKGKPLAVGGSRERGVVAAASYEARKFGVYSAMASKIAYQKCPEIIFVKPRFEVYKEVSRQIMSIFSEYTELIEPLSLDEAYLDVTLNKKNITTATQIAQEIREQIKRQTGLTASAGVSFNKFLAKIASDIKKPDGLTVITPQIAEQVIDKLRIEKFYGVGKVTADKFKSMGVFTGADLKQFTKPELIRLFGKSGGYFYDVVRLEDHRPVRPDRISKSVGAENTFDKDLYTFDEMSEELKIIAETLQVRLERKQLKGKTVTVKLKFNDFTIQSKGHTLLKYVNLAEDFLPVALELLRQSEYDQKPVRLLGITLSNLNTPQEVVVTRQLCFDF